MKSRVKAGRQFLDRDAGVEFNHDPHPEDPQYNPAQVHKLLAGLPMQPRRAHPRNQKCQRRFGRERPLGASNRMRSGFRIEFQGCLHSKFAGPKCWRQIQRKPGFSSFEPETSSESGDREGKVTG
ncbi:peptide hydrolase [Trypanosoma cruzi]|nr:peptide hydrolase [Trypanosoma cruzi]